jgi:prepilin-type N-terminal cleavage/methylation domain-containing protein
MGDRRRQDGFSLLELMIVLVLLMVGLMIAADLLMETSQLFVETSGEAPDTPVPLVIARIRGDIQGGIGVSPVLREDGSLGQVQIAALGEQIVYEKDGDTIYRTVLPQGEPAQGAQTLWRGVTDWSCQPVLGTSLIQLSVTYNRRAVPHSPLPGMPVDRGPATEQLTQSLFLLPRGAGLGDTW